ncbi:MAG: ABC transporter substrate-binding protein [Chloroflexi bacterium]|nr:ABC transporter substrate-binding protein [Chloroflexota bacterium]
MATNKVSLVIVWLLVPGLILAGCAPAAAPSAVPKPTTAPPPAAATPAPKPAASPEAKPIPTSVGTPATTSKPAGAQPKAGGIMTISTRSEPPSFDMHTESSAIVQFPVGPAYSGLIQFDSLNPGKIVPDLAEKWTVSPDGLVYTFNLRKGVKWHDGNPFTTADVLLSLERLKKHATSGSGLVPVNTIEAPDDSTVKVTLRYSTSVFINFLAIAWSAMMPKHIIDRKGNMKNDIVGTGGFKLKQFSRGSFLELERNKDYYVPGLPYLDGLRTYFIADQATALAGLRTGQVHFIRTPLSDAAAATVKETYKEASAGQVRNSQWRAIYLPVDKAPWTDIRVRKAVYLAVDRQNSIKVTMGGQAELGSQIPEIIGGIPVGELLKRPGYRQPKDADVAEAKKLLAEAGFPSGFKTSTLYRKGTEYESAALFFRDQMAKIGIDVSIKTVDDATFYDIRDKRNYDTFTHRRPVSVLDADDILMREYRTGGNDNWSNISDPELDKLIDAQSKEQDPEKRQKLVREANEKIESLYISITLCWGGYWRAWNNKVKDYKLPNAQYDDEKFTHVWLGS